jgi:hypothetical protein
MPLMRSVHRWKLDRVADEEDRLNTELKDTLWERQMWPYCIVKNPILIPLVGIHLHCPSVDIALCIGGPGFRANRRYAPEKRRGFADLVQKTSRGNVGAIVCDNKLAIGTVRPLLVQISL